MGVDLSWLNPVSWIADLGFGIYDRAKQNETNEQNIAMQQQVNAQNQANFDKQFAYQQQLNAQTMRREDNAMQRAVADAEKAGFSKWSVAGAGAAASPLTSASGGQSVGQAAHNSTQISQTAYGAELANMRASTAQAYASMKKAEYEERYYDGQLKHMNNQLKLEKFKTFSDVTFGFSDRHLKSQQLALEREKQEEVAANNKAVIEETKRHNEAVEKETNRSNRVAEQQKSQSLDIERVNLLCRQAEAEISREQMKVLQLHYENDDEYHQQCVELEKQGVKQKYAQMIVSGIVDITKFAILGTSGGTKIGQALSGANKSTLYTPNTTSYGGVSYDRK